METVHIAGRKDGSEVKQSKEDKCECGGSLEPEYGFCKHGLGMFMRCCDCFEVFDFIEDIG